MKILILGMALLFAAGTTEANAYANVKYGFSITVPKEISAEQNESDAGDGISSHSADGQAECVVFGRFLLDSAGDEIRFRAGVKSNIDSEAKDGWKIIYRKISGEKWATYSGVKGDRIFYSRSIPGCSGGSLAVYRLEYPSARKAEFDPVIKELNNSFFDGGGCKLSK